MLQPYRRGKLRFVDIVIIGGGVIGCAVAYYLTKEGADVSLLESSELAGGASGAATGMVGPPGESPHRGPLGDLCRASSSLFPSLVPALREETGIDVQYQSAGMLLVAQTEERAQALRSVVRWQGELGLRLEWIEREPLRRLEPALSPAVIGAAYSPDQRHVNPGLLTQALARAAADRGAIVHQGVAVIGFLNCGNHVTAVRTSEGTMAADHLVLAAGPWTRALALKLGINVPTRPVRGQMLAYRSTLVRHIVSDIVSGEEGSLTPKPGGFLYAGATVEDVGFRPRTTRGGLAWLRRVARTLVPALRSADVASAWAALRPGSPDGLPIIGRLPDWENVFVATGHFRTGILLAPVTGKLVSELIVTSRAGLPLDAFSPARFVPA